MVWWTRDNTTFHVNAPGGSYLFSTTSRSCEHC